MNTMTIERAAKCCGGKIYGNCDTGMTLGKVVIDSRAIEKGDLFVAYKGERVDGHDYITKAFDSGAACALAQHPIAGEDRAVIVVEDVQKALEKIAAEYRRDIHIPVIGITGSVGKTSAKEMISAVLSSELNVLKTDKNLNNQIGVPMTVSRIEPCHQAAVIEMGISGFGEMTDLAKVSRPDIAVFTIIGHAHLEFLHDLDGVMKAKTEMLDIMDENGLVIYNGDDEKLCTLKCRQKKMSFGIGASCDVRAENIDSESAESVECDISYKERRFRVHIPAYGRHMVYAALEGAAVGIAMGLTDEEIIRGIASYETVGRRAAVTKTEKLTLIDDCYNANPDSTKCGIDSLVKLPGRHVCVLGDMLELGENEKEMHREVGEYALAKGVDMVIACGELSRLTCEGAGKTGKHFDTLDMLIAALPELIEKGDNVLVKASHASHLELASEALKEL